MLKIHPTAIISEKAKLETDVEVGPYSVIRGNVVIGAGTKISNNVTIDGCTTMGKNNVVFPNAVIGSPPQDLKYKGAKSSLIIGDNNIIREFVTMNPATGDDCATVIGNDNLFMAYSHIAHDCSVANHCVFANNATLAGHVKVFDEVVIGGLSAIHQFSRVGRLAIVGGCSKVVQDVPPFATCDGHPAKVYGINYIGLRRSHFSRQTIVQIKRAFKILFHGGLALSHAVQKIKEEFSDMSSEVDQLIEFVKHSKRGISR